MRAVRERRIRGTVGGREGEKRKKQLIWVFNHHESLMKKASLIAVNQRPPGIKASTATNVTDSRTKTFTNEKRSQSNAREMTARASTHMAHAEA